MLKLPGFLSCALLCLSAGACVRRPVPDYPQDCVFVRQDSDAWSRPAALQGDWQLRDNARLIISGDRYEYRTGARVMESGGITLGAGPG